MSDSRQPDIEIYIHNRSLEQLENWMESRCSDMVKLFSLGSMHEYRGLFNGRRVPVLVHEKAMGAEWSSVWFKSSRTPWPGDLDCALEAAAALDTEIRCLTSDWVRGRSEREWWNIGNGEVEKVQWR